MVNRRQMIKMAGAAYLGAAFPLKIKASALEKKDNERPFRISINTSTISGYKLSVEQQIDVCQKAGFEGIELWIRDVQLYLGQGGNLEKLASRIRSSGMRLENMIGFAPWMTGEKGMEEMKKEMELSARLGSQCIAATCFGLERLDLGKMPEYSYHYNELITFGEQIGIRPLIELWGHRALNQLTDTVSIAIGAGHKKASLLLDFYHLYKGGNSFDSLALINGKSLPVFHINDYPSLIPRERLSDSDRVFPGDGICPFKEVLPVLYENGFRGALSLELFNPVYWQKYTVDELLRIGYEKVKTVIELSLDIKD